jgi:hypothetical protein
VCKTIILQYTNNALLVKSLFHSAFFWRVELLEKMSNNKNFGASLSSLNTLLEKTSDWDKDERYMATNDLCTLLSNPPPTLKIDEHTEQKICTAILKQLDDQSNDVQSVAVKYRLKE